MLSRLPYVQYRREAGIAALEQAYQQSDTARWWAILHHLNTLS